MQQNTIIIGYSGHSYVAIDILQKNNFLVEGYCDSQKKEFNPFNIEYLGSEADLPSEQFLQKNFFIGIGSNNIRKDIFSFLEKEKANTINVIHPFSSLANDVNLAKGIMVAAGVVINPQVKIGNAVICNTNCTIEHECVIDNFVHLAPGVIVCGNVSIGESTFVGAGAILKQGISIGKNCTIGAGAVVLNDVQDNITIIGNPGKILIK